MDKKVLSRRNFPFLDWALQQAVASCERGSHKTTSRLQKKPNSSGTASTACAWLKRQIESVAHGSNYFWKAAPRRCFPFDLLLPACQLRHHSNKIPPTSPNKVRNTNTILTQDMKNCAISKSWLTLLTINDITDKMVQAEFPERTPANVVHRVE